MSELQHQEGKRDCCGRPEWVYFSEDGKWRKVAPCPQECSKANAEGDKG